MCQHCNSHAQVVEAESVADYLRRYYKPDRLVSTGFEVLQRSYEIELEVYGFVVTSHYDNVTGGLIAWPHFKEWSEMMQEQVERERELRDKDPILNPQASPQPKYKTQQQRHKEPTVDPFD